MVGIKKFAPYLLIACLVFLGYGNTFLNSFHYDDIPSVLEKPWVRGLDKIPDILTNIWIRPVVILTFNINHAISGFDVWSYHVFNIFFHLAVTLLIYRMARMFLNRLMRTRTEEGGAMHTAPLFAAMIFAVHPLNTQSVTYISSRSSILVTFFYLLTLLLFFKGYARWSDSGEKKDKSGAICLGLAVLSLALGALSKEIIVTIPGILFLAHYYFYSGLSFRKWLGANFKWIALIGAPMAAFILYKHFSETGILPTQELILPSSTYFLTQTFVIPFQYFWKMLFPVNLNIDIHFPIIQDWLKISNYAGLLALAVYTLMVFKVSRRFHLAGFGMAWAFITILPTSSFVPLYDVAVEHRTYLPMVGFSMAMGAVFSYFLHRINLQKESGHRLIRFAPQVGAVMILICFSAMLIKRNAVWKDEVTLWTDAKKKSPNLIRPYNNLGEAYDKLRQFEKAKAEFESALKIQPDYTFALSNLGNVHGKLGDYPKAIFYFKKALALKENYPPAQFNLARAYQGLNRPAEAYVHYKKAVKYSPHFEPALYNLGLISLRLGRFDESVEMFNRFIAMQPGNFRGYFGLGNAYLQAGKFELAAEAYKKSAGFNPRYILARINLAMAQMGMEKYDEAIASYESILAAGNPIAGIHKNLGLLYYQHRPDLKKALFHFSESLRLDPNQPQAEKLRPLKEDLKKKLEGKSPPPF